MVDVDGAQSLLEESKKRGMTLAPLLTAAIVCTVADALPEAPRLVGVTPYTLRRVTGTSMDEMANQTSGFDTSYSKDLLDRVRNSSNAMERVESLWHIAGYFHAQMQEELAQCPCDNLVGLLPYVSDHIKFYQKKFGQAREATFEMSNLGVFRTQDQGSATWRLKNMTFTQGAQVMGPAINVKCVTVEDGSLAIAVTWQSSVVHEDIVDALADYLLDLPRFLQSWQSNDMGMELDADTPSR